VTQPPTVAQLRNLVDRAATGLTPDEQQRLRDGLDQLAHATDSELRRQLADAIRALGTSETELARLRADIAACRNQQWPQRLGQAEKRLARITALTDRWAQAGPPPLGTPLARCWDKRLAELNAALDEPAPATPTATQATDQPK
jgi:DNA repair ATPase RecN